jgi:hypothetical protein
MSRKLIIPVQMRRVRDPNGRETLRATVPMSYVFDKSFDATWLEEELVKCERRYFYLVTCQKYILESLRSKTQRDGRVLLYWEFGNKFVNFVEEQKSAPLCIEGLVGSLKRDVGVSDKMVTRCKRLRLSYPDVTKIDPNKSFTNYVATFEGGYIPQKRRSDKEKAKGAV